MNDCFNSNRLLSVSIGADDVVGVQKALNMGAHLTGATLLDDNLYDVECAVLNLPLNQAYEKKASDEIITLLKKAGATYDIPNIYRCSALYFAAASDSCALAQKLIQEGSQIDARNLFGETPLHIAVLAGHKKMVKLLCENGANIFLSDKNGRTPLQLVALMGRINRGTTKQITQKQIDEMQRILVCSEQMQQIEPVKIASQKQKVWRGFQKEKS